MKITVIGLGYVGLANAILLAQHNEVMAVDIVPEKIAMINSRKSPLVDPEIEDYLSEKALNLQSTTDYKAALQDASYVVIATPTNYDSEKNFFDTGSVENAIVKVLKYQPHATMVIKSTIPVGY